MSLQKCLPNVYVREKENDQLNKSKRKWEDTKISTQKFISWSATEERFISQAVQAKQDLSDWFRKLLPSPVLYSDIETSSKKFTRKGLINDYLLNHFHIKK